MNGNQAIKFEQFLQESFTQGISYRELRLSREEVEYVLLKCPSARITRSPVEDCSDGKAWYEIHLSPIKATLEDLIDTSVEFKMSELERENQRLKEELEKVKNKEHIVFRK